MLKVEFTDRLRKILKKLFKKDRRRFDIVFKKIEEISSSDPSRYKNLGYDLKQFRRVHIDSHFVLIFKINGDIIKFEDLQHHDRIYE